jgi:hypothetical protein
MEKTGDESPKNKVKFLCSYGGKVLPRPSDGVLKYVGGETRIICIPRDVTFSGNILFYYILSFYIKFRMEKEDECFVCVITM